MALLAPGSAVPSALVALTVFRASAWACLLCFTSYNERLQICQIFTGLESPDLGKCEEAFTDAFKGLLDTEISEATPPPSSRAPRGACGGRDQRGLERLRGMKAQRREDGDLGGGRDSETGGQRLCGGQRLRDGRTETLRGPETQRRGTRDSERGRGRSTLGTWWSFRVAFPHAAEKIQKIILQLKEGELQVGTCRDLQGSNACSLSAVQACIPPCGLQEVARRFRCRGCYSTVCDLPLDCPVQDLTVTRGHQAMFFCTVNFQLPKEEITYSWKFAGGGIPRARGYLARIRPVQPTHRGTFSCVITHDQRPLARLYFFL
ncbi:hypothetical protein E2I00_010203, partial [Balaenoptera physalus]